MGERRAARATARPAKSSTVDAQDGSAGEQQYADERQLRRQHPSAGTSDRLAQRRRVIDARRASTTARKSDRTPAAPSASPTAISAAAQNTPNVSTVTPGARSDEGASSSTSTCVTSTFSRLDPAVGHETAQPGRDETRSDVAAEPELGRDARHASGKRDDRASRHAGDDGERRRHARGTPTAMAITKHAGRDPRLGETSRVELVPQLDSTARRAVLMRAIAMPGSASSITAAAP